MENYTIPVDIVIFAEIKYNKIWRQGKHFSHQGNTGGLRTTVIGGNLNIYKSRLKVKSTRHKFQRFLSFLFHQSPDIRVIGSNFG